MDNNLTEPVRVVRMINPDVTSKIYEVARGYERQIGLAVNLIAEVEQSLGVMPGSLPASVLRDAVGRDDAEAIAELSIGLWQDVLDCLYRLPDNDRD